MKPSRALLALLLSYLALPVWAAPTPVEVPLNIPYALVRAQLAERVFIEPKETLHALSDASGCNKLKLSAPKIEGAAAGGMQVAMHLEGRGGTPVPAGACLLPFLDIYRTPLRATAWQETCWRQYVRASGRIEAWRSSAGSVGLMQINQHLWRGVYDLHKLASDIAYNARASNEILVHYLVDFAIKKKEHEVSGDAHNRARQLCGL